MTATTNPPPVLLLIDLQQGIVDGPEDWGPRSTPDLVENVTSLLTTWRMNRWPIMHVHHDDIFDPTNIISAKWPETFAAHACAAKGKGERRYVKNGGSAFVGTGLKDDLRMYVKPKWRGREAVGKVVVCGMDGRECVNSTARHGVDLGFEMVVVGDACASYGMRSWKKEGRGDILNAEETHAVAMGMLEGYCEVTSRQKLLGTLRVLEDGVEERKGEREK
ncbi:Isochorismatase-like protein [Tricladium varicosporioides]|nr:Isochorismatase-like protein [Hymenoscyphus varicosporioides]